MNQEILQKYVERVSLEYFKKPFKHKAYNNKRLRTTGGRYHLNTHNLDFNLKVHEKFGEEVFLGIVKHELCHYHLHLEKKGYRHKDSDFKELLKKVKGLRYTPSLQAEKKILKVWEYSCTGCQKSIYRQRRFNVHRFVCRECNSKFKLLGRKEVASENSKTKAKTYCDLKKSLHKPAKRALEAAGIDSIEDLYEIGEKELLKLHGFGPRSIERIEKYTNRKFE